VAVCSSCGQENPDGFRFCGACGTELPAAAPAGVRKTVTVLFCDLVGSTAIGDRVDPEPLRELMARYHGELRTILERHGGTVEKFVGDAAMAVFGIPQVHEDDALRAALAATEIRDSIERLGLEVRIGINTGQVVAGQGETLITGDAVNVAARLEQAGAAGEILLGEATEWLVRGAVRAEPIELLELKGKAEPVPAYRLLELLPDVPAFTRPLEAPFVGREHELETLSRTLAKAIEERSPQLATIVGPPGIGKSRLARELIQGAEARVLVGRCLSYGEGITYWPLAEIVSQAGDLRAALGDAEDAELAAARIAAALGAAETGVSEEIAWGFRKLFEALARKRLLIVVVDDVHWAEPTLLDLIEYVAAFAEDASLVLLCMARSDLFELRPDWATPKPNATLVTLEPLAASETERLVDQLRDVAADTRARIVEAAEGNPLFVEQLLAMHAENGQAELEIPPTIQSLLAARIDRLDPEQRSVLERASIEGRTFHRGSVQELLPKHARTGVGGHLLSLVRKEFVRPDRSQLPGDDGFRFGHILIRDAAYDSIPKRLRAELHERFADWLEARLGDDAPDEILGYHLEQACRYRIELSSDDKQTRKLASKAGRLLMAAGRRANARRDAAATCSLLGRATQLLPHEDPELPPLLELLGTATSEAGDHRGALEILRRAQSAAAAAGQTNIQLRARMSELVILIGANPEQGTEEALAQARAAIAELAPFDDLESLTRAWHVVTSVANVRSDFALLAESERNRFELARRGGLHHEAGWAAAWLVLPLAMGPVPVAEAIRQAHQVREEYIAAFPGERPGDLFLPLLYAFAGRHEEAYEAFERARHALLELGQRTNAASMTMTVGWIALLAAEPERAEAELREGAEVLEAGGETGTMSTVAAVLAEVLYQLGRDEEAEEWTRRSESASSPEDILSQALLRATRAKVLARQGAAKDAVRLAEEAVGWARRSDGLPFLGDCLAARGEVLIMLGHGDEARPVLEEALAVYERKGIVPSIERTRKLLAEV
jgi:class 3 adenylate cyclase/tetratricopeptide (TPR) repeat protein